ncbi:MAG: MBL fold metallo-hydrolase [Bacteroidales bacterium]
MIERLFAPALLWAAMLLQAPAHPPAPPVRTQLILLGTGTPVPDPDAWGPASAVVVGDRLFLVDAGAGVTRRLAASGFPRVKDVEATFITHLHSDHTLGYPDLVFTTWIMGRRSPLVVYGPPGLQRMTEKLLDAWTEDIDERVNGLERETRGWLKVEVREIASLASGPSQPTVVSDRAGVRISAVRVRHGDWPAFACRFDTPTRSITFSGDTAPGDALLTLARGTDVLVHEVYDSARVKPENRPGGEHWPDYLRSYHTSDVEVGQLAAKANVKLLVLSHVMRLGGSDGELIEHVRAGGYTGRVVVAKDLDRY